MSNSKRQGWGWPGLARKAHYFDGEIVSLCGRWMFSGAMFDDRHNSPHNCQACRRKLEKLHPEKLEEEEGDDTS